MAAAATRADVSRALQAVARERGRWHRQRAAPPAEFPPGEGGWANFALQPDEIELKKRALLAYSSQMLVIGRFMLAFGRSNELFLEGEPASMPECWCDGENVATELPASQYRRRPRRR